MGKLAVIHENRVPSFSMGDVERIAVAIAKGGLFGSKDPNAVLTLCLLAQAEGQHPAVVFRDYHIISGRPAKKADAMLRDFISAGGKIKWHCLDDECADATFTHPSGEARIEWTLRRAQQAGIANPMWKKYPRQMLRSRVISEGVRTVFPGATSGLYEENEVRDIVTDEPRGDDRLVDAATGPVEGVAPRPVMTGPYTSKTKLWAAVRAFDRELRSCGDLDQFECFLATEDSKALLAQCENDAPTLLYGSAELPPEYEPLVPLIAKMRTNFEAAISTGLVTENGTTILDA